MTRITTHRRARAPRYLRLGPFWLWVVRIPLGTAFAVGQIAATDTPNAPLPGQAGGWDAQGKVLVVGGIAFAVLRCRRLRCPPGH